MFLCEILRFRPTLLSICHRRQCRGSSAGPGSRREKAGVLLFRAGDDRLLRIGCLLAHGEEPDVRSQWLAAGLRRYAIGVSESGVRFDCSAAMVAGRAACDSGLTAGKARDAVMDSVRWFSESVRGGAGRSKTLSRHGASGSLCSADALSFQPRSAVQSGLNQVERCAASIGP